MIRGYVFANQLASNEIDSMIYRKMLNYNDGVFRGMELSHTSTTITVQDGLIMMAGRPVGIIGNEKVTVGTDNAFCKLVLEIDLTKEATESTFEQVSLKVIKSTSSYPDVTQNDMDNGGTLYQVELAKFKTSINGIIDFVDTRKFLDFEGIWETLIKKSDAKIKEINQKLAEVENGSAYVLKSSFLYGDADDALDDSIGNEGDIYFQVLD